VTELELPPSLDLLTSWWVIGGSVALYGVEFVAEMIPAVYILWNPLITFVGVRVPTLSASAATARLSPGEQLLAAAIAAALLAVIVVLARVVLLPIRAGFAGARRQLGSASAHGEL
jgi:hypothetical protein